MQLFIFQHWQYNRCLCAITICYGMCAAPGACFTHFPFYFTPDKFLIQFGPLPVRVPHAPKSPIFAAQKGIRII